MRKLMLSAIFAALFAGFVAAPSADAQLFRRGRVSNPSYSSSAYPIYTYSSPTQSVTPAPGSTNSVAYYPGGAETASIPQGSPPSSSYYPGGAGYEPQFQAPYRYPTYNAPIYSPGSAASSSYYPGGASYEPQYNYNYPSYRSGAR